MQRLQPRPAVSVCLLLFGLFAMPVVAMAQPAADPPKPAAAKAAADDAEPEKIVVPKIADEPRAVDPTNLVNPALQAKFKVRFEETPVSDVVKWLKDEAKLTVILDQRAMQDAGVLSSEPVSDRLDDEPVYLLLDRLSTIGLQWWVSGKIVHVSASDGQHIYTKQYNVGDLFDQDHDPDTLLETITASISAESWEEVGGPGSIVLLGDVLFVRQSNRVHRKVLGLLTALRKYSKRTLIDDPPQHEQIRKALQENVDASFRNVGLKAAVTTLGAAAKTDIRLDLRALKEMGVRDRQPVDLEIEEQPLSVALDVLASQYKLAWMIRDGVLWITSEDEVEANLQTAVFDVQDLCRDGEESDSLQAAIESQSSPDSWSSVGGAGEIAFPLPGVMVISQTESRLDGILQLLQNYRDALRVSKPRVRPESDPKAIITRYYRLPTNVAEDLVTALPHLVRPETWAREGQGNAPGLILNVLSSSSEVSKTGADGNVKSVTQPHSVLVIKQMREVHDEIPGLIQRVLHGDSMQMGFGGGMGGMGGGFGGGFFKLKEQQPTKRNRIQPSKTPFNRKR